MGRSNSQMVFISSLTALILCLGITVPNASAHSPLKFDEFGLLPCTQEITRLDNYGSQLRKVPNALAVVIIYGDRLHTRQGEVAARLFAIRDHLVKNNSIGADRIIILDGGFLERLQIELWMIPSQDRPSGDFLIDPEASRKPLHLQRPRIRTWEYKCVRN